MAKLVDLQGKWAAAIGRAFVAFGSIEHTTVVCLRNIPRDNLQTFARSLKLVPRVELLRELLAPYEQPEAAQLASVLGQVKALAPTRNLIAHNPLVLEFYEDPNGGYTFRESIAAIHKEGHKITLGEVEQFASASESLATNLIVASTAAFGALGVTARA